MTRKLRIRDIPMDAHRELQRILPTYQVDQNQNLLQPPAAGLVTQHQDVYFIPPPRVVGGAQGGLNPSEYGNAGAHPSARPISRGAAARESRLISDTFHKTPSVQHNERYLALVRRSIHCMSFTFLISSYHGFGQPSLQLRLITFYSQPVYLCTYILI